MAVSRKLEIIQESADEEISDQKSVSSASKSDDMNILADANKP